MKKLLLTQGTVDKLAPSSMQSVFYDSELSGFGLAVAPGGAKTWIVWYRAGKGHRDRLRRISLGNTAEMTAAEAREVATRVLDHAKAACAGDRNDMATPTVAEFARRSVKVSMKPNDAVA